MSATKQIDLTSSQRAFYSQDLLYNAMPMLVFYAFASKKTDLLKEPGASIKFSKFDELAVVTEELQDGVEMTDSKISDSEIEITVKEYGKAVAVTQKAITTNNVDILLAKTTVLARNLAKSFDSIIRNVALTTTNYKYGKGVAASSSLTTSDVFDTQIVKDAVEYLRTNDVPKIDGEYYICVATPHQLRDLSDDTKWIGVNQYNKDGMNIYKGEVGMYEGVRFVSTTNMPHLTPAQSSVKYGVAIDLYESLFFGENAFGIAEALKPEIRTKNNNDYGRLHGMAWYAIFGVGLIEEKNILIGLTA